MNKIQLSVDGISTTPLAIGFEGENEHTEITFYWTSLFNKYPDAVATMIIRPPTGNPYPKTVTQEDNKVVWDVTASDTYIPGTGAYQLTFTNGTEIIKTYIGSFLVLESITGNGEAPDPVQDWVDDANALLAEYEQISASAETLSSGSPATAEITEVDGHRNIAIGVPAGASMEDVTVTGSTPSITGVANKRYLCGTVTSLSITPPASGMIDVIFTVGSTLAVLTLPNTVKMPGWFEIQKNHIYEINISDATYGVVMAWQTA